MLLLQVARLLQVLLRVRPRLLLLLPLLLV
jgi:hypothetical protein